MFPHIMISAIVFVLTMSAPAHADSCPTAKAIRQEILNCGLNTAATKHAKACAAHIHEEADTLDAEARKAIFSHGAAEMRAVAHQVVAGVRKMQAESANVAKYTDAMIDLPGSTSRETSLDCFNSEFDQIQKLVNAMDEDIIGVTKAFDELTKAYGALPRPAR